MKRVKKIILIVLVVCLVAILTYCGWVLRRYMIFTKITDNYMAFNEQDNFYFYKDGSGNGGMITEFWKKDGIIRAVERNAKYPETIAIEHWIDTNTGETYNLEVEQKTYNTSTMMNYLNNITQSRTTPLDNLTMFHIIIDPRVKVKVADYNDTPCYYINEFDFEEEYVEKSTGVSLFSKMADREDATTTSYTLNTVTDKDVEKPSLEGYTLREI